MSDDVKNWLEKLGLGKYAEVFSQNEIDFRALPRLSEDDLKALALTLMQCSSYIRWRPFSDGRELVTLGP